jgi:signal transduction histidine kinase
MENETEKPLAMLNPPQDSIEGGENLEKIRDLLFGTHMRKLEVTLARMEERLVRKMGDILDLSRIDAQKLELADENFSLSECINETMTMLSQRASTKGLELNCRIEDSTPDALMGDPSRISLGRGVPRKAVWTTMSPSRSGAGYWRK